MVVWWGTQQSLRSAKGSKDSHRLRALQNIGAGCGSKGHIDNFDDRRVGLPRQFRLGGCENRAPGCEFGLAGQKRTPSSNGAMFVPPGVGGHSDTAPSKVMTRSFRRPKNCVWAVSFGSTRVSEPHCASWVTAVQSPATDGLSPQQEISCLLGMSSNPLVPLILLRLMCAWV